MALSLPVLNEFPQDVLLLGTANFSFPVDLFEDAFLNRVLVTSGATLPNKSDDSKRGSSDLD